MSEAGTIFVFSDLHGSSHLPEKLHWSLLWLRSAEQSRGTGRNYLATRGAACFKRPRPSWLSVERWRKPVWCLFWSSSPGRHWDLPWCQHDEPLLRPFHHKQVRFDALHELIVFFLVRHGGSTTLIFVSVSTTSCWSWRLSSSSLKEPKFSIATVILFCFSPSKSFTISVSRTSVPTPP